MIIVMAVCTIEREKENFIRFHINVPAELQKMYPIWEKIIIIIKIIYFTNLLKNYEQIL